MQTHKTILSPIFNSLKPVSVYGLDEPVLLLEIKLVQDTILKQINLKNDLTGDIILTHRLSPLTSHKVVSLYRAHDETPASCFLSFVTSDPCFHQTAECFDFHCP